jgi:hypothetical protein
MAKIGVKIPVFISVSKNLTHIEKENFAQVNCFITGSMLRLVTRYGNKSSDSIFLSITTLETAETL